MKKIFNALKFCANGDGNPVCPPSKVICKKCMDKISDTISDIILSMDEPKIGNKEKGGYTNEEND